MLDPESKDMYHCLPHHFLEISETQVNEPIGSYQIQHLNIAPIVLLNGNSENMFRLFSLDDIFLELSPACTRKIEP